MADVSAGSLESYPNYDSYKVNPSNYETPWLTRAVAPGYAEERARAYEADKNAADMRYQADRDKWLAHREDTQVQRLVADLKAAGLNPWLAVQNGFTANNTPSISSFKTSANKFDGYKDTSKYFSNILTTALKIGIFLALL